MEGFVCGVVSGAGFGVFIIAVVSRILGGLASAPLISVFLSFVIGCVPLIGFLINKYKEDCNVC